ncbi:aminopeptidase [Clostridium kluyveri]|uniref:aminopeptidase n=1 Tax=Clostridium kluyveri TaxID=1534 RepID=UPI002247F244|nr:hypothetical protein [Clostridium kluyveri]UZQ50532.1 hypothetical protein OP486_21800 [Clostridium kluyveri]
MELVLQESAKYIIDNCTDIGLKTRVLIIYDSSTKKILKYFTSQLKDNCKEVSVWEIPVSDRHGEEPVEDLYKKMLSVNVILCMTRYSLAHTKARKLANERGIGFLSMPGYNADMMPLSAIKADYKSCVKTVERVSNLLSDASKIEINSKAGTKLYIDATGRKGNCCPGFINEKYLLGSPPDVEANVAPIEEKTEGIIVVDGSITHEKLGLLNLPMVLKIEKGKLSDISSEDENKKNILGNILINSGSDKALIVGELGIGLNPEAKLCGNMLVDEGTYGCIHFGFGSNWTIGGENKVDFHLDFVINSPTLIIDNNVIIKEGELT